MKTERQAELCQEFYDVLMPALRYKAKACGYALGVHGSLKRDIDLIAAPWRIIPIPAESLIEELKSVVLAVIGTARAIEGTIQPQVKPVGRLAWSIYLTPDDDGPYLDISVMPFIQDVNVDRST